jgi:hypothetical protein
MDKPQSVHDAISRAEALLPGVAAPEGEMDDRWQAIIEVAEFSMTEPEAVWEFVTKWGQHKDEDVRAAVATCVLEHLLAINFDLFFGRMEGLALANQNFAKTVAMCWDFGEMELPENAERMRSLRARIRG